MANNKAKTKAAIRRLQDLVDIDAPPRMIYRQLSRVFREINEFCFPPGEAECEVLFLANETLQDVVKHVTAAESGAGLA
jgi:hypothetical protein